METLRGLILGGCKVTADGDCGHEIKRHFLFGRKTMTNLDSILKSRDITLPTKVCLVKSMVYPIITYRCESWTIRKTEHWRIDAFELWYWRGLLSILYTARTSNQPILKEISPEYWLEGLMLKLNVQYFGHLMQRANSLEKTLMLGKIQGGRRKGQQRTTWLGGITDPTDMSLSKFRELVEDREAWCTAVMGSQRVGNEQLNNNKKLKGELRYDPKPTLSTSSKEMKIWYWRNICTPIFTIALFTTTKIWKQSKCECVRKMDFIHTSEYYWAIRRKEILPFGTTWVDLIGTMLKE